MPIDQRVLKSEKNRFLQVDSRQSVGEAFLLLASPEVNGQGWWHLVVLMPDGSWAAVRFSRLYEEVRQDPSLLDASLERIEALQPVYSAERSSLETGEAIQLARSSPCRLLAVTEKGALAGILFEGGMRGGMRGGPAPSQEDFRQLAASSRQAQSEHRFTDVSCPRRVSLQTERFSVVVRLTLDPNRLSAAVEKLKADIGRTVQVRLYAPGFEVLGPDSQQIRLEPKKDSPPAVFDLRPKEAGTQHLSLEFYQGADLLATVDVPTDVLEEPVAEASVKLPSLKLQAASGVACPDRVLRIFWDQRRASLRFSLLREGGASWQDFPALSLQQSPSEYAQSLFGDLSKWSEAFLQDSASLVANSQGLSTDQVDRRFKTLGQNLWRSGLPEELKRLYANERDAWKDRTIMILSDEPYIPWELLWPYGEDWEDEEPWCLNLRLSRWLCRDERGNGNPCPPGHLPLSSMLLLAAADSSLPLVEKERDYLVRLMQCQGVRALQPEPASWEKVMEMLESEAYDWLHLAGHGEFSPSSADRHAPLHLNGAERLTPQEFVGPRLEGHLRRKRPAFVLNACHAARQEFGLTRLEGWAARLIAMGAGMFLGPLWAVSDKSALGLTRTLYQALLDGLTLAEALRKARQASRRIGSPAWLAYSIYGHPNACLKVTPAKGCHRATEGRE